MFLNETNGINVVLVGNPDYGQKADKPYRCTTFLQSIFAVPCIAAQVWLQGGVNPPELAYLHAGLPLIPFAAYLSGKEKKDIGEVVVALNLASMGVISFMGKKYYGVAAAVSFALNYFVIKDQGDFADSIPAIDLFNYGMCFACYFALRGLAGEWYLYKDKICNKTMA